VYEKERERRFQYEIAKAQSDFEFSLALSIGVFAALLSVTSFFKDVPLLGLVDTGLAFTVLIVIVYLFIEKERRFEEIKREYIESYWD
jgi:hypothetical protein